MYVSVTSRDFHEKKGGSWYSDLTWTYYGGRCGIWSVILTGRMSLSGLKTPKSRSPSALFSLFFCIFWSLVIKRTFFWSTLVGSDEIGDVRCIRSVPGGPFLHSHLCPFCQQWKRAEQKPDQDWQTFSLFSFGTMTTHVPYWTTLL